MTGASLAPHTGTVFDQGYPSGQGFPLWAESDRAYTLGMPRISAFFSIVIEMFWREHGPPHFHATYAEHEAVIDLESLDIIRGHLPKRAFALVRDGQNSTMQP